jgi:hypothetical protein
LQKEALGSEAFRRFVHEKKKICEALEVAEAKRKTRAEKSPQQYH